MKMPRNALEHPGVENVTLLKRKILYFEVFLVGNPVRFLDTFFPHGVFVSWLILYGTSPRPKKPSLEKIRHSSPSMPTSRNPYLSPDHSWTRLNRCRQRPWPGPRRIQE